MNRCPYCGGRMIGSRDGWGLHLSTLAVSLVIGVVGGILTWVWLSW